MSGTGLRHVGWDLALPGPGVGWAVAAADRRAGVLRERVGYFDPNFFLTYSRHRAWPMR